MLPRREQRSTAPLFGERRLRELRRARLSAATGGPFGGLATTRETGGLGHVSGWVNGGTIDTGRPHCSAAVSESGDTGETNVAAQRFTGSTPERSSQCCASDPFNRHRRIRHLPPANSDSWSESSGRSGAGKKSGASIRFTRFFCNNFAVCSFSAKT